MNSYPLPMLATLGQPPARFADFAVEAKYDGQRGIAVLDERGATLLSRNGADITRTFPEIAAALPTLPGRNLILDGEIVATDDRGVPNFGRLQQRWPQNRRPSAALQRRIPVRFWLFDILRVNDVDVTTEPYEARRARLCHLAGDAGPIIQVPGSWPGADPAAVLAAVAENGLEGIVTKRLTSTYTPGARSPDWIKTPLRKRSEFIIGGWLPGSGPNRHTVGVLLLGAWTNEGRLQFCGSVSAGLNTAQRRHLLRALEPLQRRTSPFIGLAADAAADARWVTPEFVVDVEYREFRRTLRHPSFKGLRGDVDSRDVSVPETV